MTINRRKFLKHAIGPTLMPISLCLPNYRIVSASEPVTALWYIYVLGKSLHQTYKIASGTDTRTRYLKEIATALSEIESNQKAIFDEIDKLSLLTSQTLKKEEINRQNSELRALIKQYNRLSNEGDVRLQRKLSTNLDRLVISMGVYSNDNFIGFLLGTCIQLAVYKDSPHRNEILRALWFQKQRIFKSQYDANNNSSIIYKRNEVNEIIEANKFQNIYPKEIEIIRYAKVYPVNDEYKRDLKAQSISLRWEAKGNYIIVDVMPGVRIGDNDGLGFGMSDSRTGKLQRKSGEDRFVIEAFPSSELTRRTSCIGKTNEWMLSSIAFSDAQTHYRELSEIIADCLRSDFRQRISKENSLLDVFGQLEMLWKSTEMVQDIISNA